MTVDSPTPILKPMHQFCSLHWCKAGGAGPGCTCPIKKVGLQVCRSRRLDALKGGRAIASPNMTLRSSHVLSHLCQIHYPCTHPKHNKNF